MRQHTLISDFLHARSAFGSEVRRPVMLPAGCRCAGGEKARFSFPGHRSKLGDGVHVPRGPLVGLRDAQLGAPHPVGVMHIDLARAEPSLLIYLPFDMLQCVARRNVVEEDRDRGVAGPVRERVVGHDLGHFGAVRTITPTGFPA